MTLFEEVQFSSIQGSGRDYLESEMSPKGTFPHKPALRLFFGNKGDPVEHFDGQIELLQFTSRSRQNIGGLMYDWVSLSNLNNLTHFLCNYIQVVSS